MDQQDLDKKQIYKCDPRKNTSCSKTGCFYRSQMGVCRHTTKKECSVDGIAYSINDLFKGEESDKTPLVVQ